MEFSKPLTEAILLRRYKRFLADIAVNKRDRETIYCPNTGAMRGLDVLGSRIWYSSSENQRRKYPHTWEIVEVDGGYLVCVNSQLKCPLVLEAIENGMITEFQGYETIEQEVCVANVEGKFDFKLTTPESDEADLYVNVQSVTMGDEIHRGFFPDAINLRATQQLKELMMLKERGERAAFLYCVMHTGINQVFPADHLDSQFGQTLRLAHKIGVEIYAYRAKMDEQSIMLIEPAQVFVPERFYGSRAHSKN